MDRKTEMTPWKDRRPDKYHAQDAKTSTSRYDIRFAENSFTIFSFSVFVLRPSLTCRGDICFFLRRAMKYNWSWLEMSVETIMSGLSSFFFYLKSKGKKQRLRLQFSANAEHWHGPKIMVSMYSFQTPCFDMLTGHLQSHTLHPKWGEPTTKSY